MVIGFWADNGGVSSDTKNGPELLEPKAKALRRGEAPTKPNNHAASSSSPAPVVTKLFFFLFYFYFFLSILHPSVSY